MLEEYVQARWGALGAAYFRLDGTTNRIAREMDMRSFNAPGSSALLYLISCAPGPNPSPSPSPNPYPNAPGSSTPLHLLRARLPPPPDTPRALSPSDLWCHVPSRL